MSISVIIIRLCFIEPVYFEEVTLVFDLFPEGQITLADKFEELFWSNALYDWSP